MWEVKGGREGSIGYQTYCKNASGTVFLILILTALIQVLSICHPLRLGTLHPGQSFLLFPQQLPRAESAPLSPLFPVPRTGLPDRHLENH